VRSCFWPRAVGGERVSQSLLDRRGMHIEGVGDLGAVDDERLLELVLQLQQLPHGGLKTPMARSNSTGVLRSLVLGWPASW
jgi:hypothetical protein